MQNTHPDTLSAIRQDFSSPHHDSLQGRGPDLSEAAPAVPVPESVTKRSEWSWLRRKCGLPPLAAQERIAAWTDLQERLENARKKMPDSNLAWPIPKRGGIFWPSLVFLENLGSSSSVTFCVEGQTVNGGNQKRAVLTCPRGQWAISTTMEDFAFDITEIDGIGRGKSSGKYFPTVQAFGLDFTEYKKTEVSANGLAKMLAHGEVRLIHSPGAEQLGVQMWDGRLFLHNDGGSHHLAGAAYISRTCSIPVQIQSKLIITALNVAAVDWLLSAFVPLAIHKKGLGQSGLPLVVAKLAGSCYEMRVAGNLCEDTRILLVPRNAGPTSDIVTALISAGALDLTAWFRTLLQQQAENQITLQNRFGGRLQFPVQRT